MEDERSFGEEESGDHGLAGLSSAHCFPHLNGERVERYSRKVFVGGLPPDIDEGKEVFKKLFDFRWKRLENSEESVSLRRNAFSDL